MIAGHIMLHLSWGAYEYAAGTSLIFGITTFLLYVFVFLLELLIMGLQAYIFTLLSALYAGELLSFCAKPVEPKRLNLF